MTFKQKFIVTGGSLIVLMYAASPAAALYAEDLAVQNKPADRMEEIKSDIRAKKTLVGTSSAERLNKDEMKKRIEEKREELKDKMEARREVMETRVANIKENAASQEAEIKERLEARAKDRVVMLFGYMSRRLEAAINRFYNITDRMETRLARMEELGVNTNSMETELKTIVSDIDAIAVNLEAAKKEVETVFDSEQPREGFIAIKESISAVAEDLREVHGDLKTLAGKMRTASQDLKTDTATEAADPADETDADQSDE